MKAEQSNGSRRTKKKPNKRMVEGACKIYIVGALERVFRHGGYSLFPRGLTLGILVIGILTKVLTGYKLVVLVLRCTGPDVLIYLLHAWRSYGVNLIIIDPLPALTYTLHSILPF